MTRQEHDAIYDYLRQRIIAIPHECFIVRFRDVTAIIDALLDASEGEKDDTKVE